MNIILMLNYIIQLYFCSQYTDLTNSYINNKNNANNTLINNKFNNSFIETKKNLILGTIIKYSLKKILPFFNSLINANFSNCDVVIFIKKVNKRVINYLNKIGVILITISNEYNNLDIPKLRWKFYMEYLQKNKIKYNMVLTNDIRDVIFQNDIFEYYKDNKSFIGISLEDETLNQEKNKMWIINFAGEEKHSLIKNERVICFGSIWGTIDKILPLSIIMWEKIKNNNNSTDQGIGNYLFYYEKIFNNCLIKSDNYGPVINIGFTERDKIILDYKDNILNFNGKIASVIHQYDRKLDIRLKIKRKYVYKVYLKQYIIKLLITIEFLFLLIILKFKIILVKTKINKLNK